MEYCSAFKKEILSRATTWVNLSEHYAKWNKPFTKGQKLSDYQYEVSKTVKIIEIKSRKVVAKEREKGAMGTEF